MEDQENQEDHSRDSSRSSNDHLTSELKRLERLKLRLKRKLENSTILINCAKEEYKRLLKFYKNHFKYRCVYCPYYSCKRVNYLRHLIVSHQRSRNLHIDRSKSN